MADSTPAEIIHKVAEEPEKIAPVINKAVAPRWVRLRRAALFQLYLVLAIVAFGTLSFFAHSNNYFPIDLQATLAIQSINNIVVDIVMRFISVLGYAPQGSLIPVLVIALLFVTGLKWESVVTAFSVGGSGLVGGLIKLVVARSRPDSALVRVFQPVNEFSFPSGHVLFYVCFVGFLWFLCYTLVKHGWQRTLALWLFGISIALAGPSRVYLGAHWASDVLGAYLLGSIWLLLSVALYRWGKTRFFVTQPVAPSKPGVQPASS